MLPFPRRSAPAGHPSATRATGSRTGRRRGGGRAALGALAALAGAALAVPIAPAGTAVAGPVPDPGSGGGTAATLRIDAPAGATAPGTLSVTVRSPGGPARAAVLTVTPRDLPEVARLTPDPRCTPATTGDAPHGGTPAPGGDGTSTGTDSGGGSTGGTGDGSSAALTCRLGTVTAHGTTLRFRLTRATGAAAGAMGSLAFTASAPGGDSDGDDVGTASATTTVTAGGAVLTARTVAPVTGLSPGATFSFTPAVRNAGDATAEGVGIAFWASPGLTPADGDAGCRSTRAGSGAGSGVLVTCLVPGARIAPGAALRTTRPVVWRAARSLMSGSVRYQAWALDGTPPDGVTAAGGTSAGGGAAPALGSAGSAPAAAFPAASATVTVATGLRTDLAAIGATVTARPGSTAKVTLGVRNAGPGSVDLPAGAPAATWYVRPPAGTTVTAVSGPGGARVTGQGIAAHPFAAPADLAAGASATLTVTLRVDRIVPGARGSVTVLPGAGVAGRDSDPGDDTATLVVRAPGSGASVVPAARTSASPGAGAGAPAKHPGPAGRHGTGDAAGAAFTGGGPGLADTGARQLVLSCGAAALCTGLGLGLVGIERRRRAAAA
jgi:hypothetical protein